MLLPQPTVTLLLAALASAALASPTPALAPRNKVVGPSLSPAQQRKLSSLKSQYASLKTKTRSLASQASSISSAQRAASRSLSSVAAEGASLEAVASPTATATPFPAPSSGCASAGQVAAPGPNGGQDPVCVSYCFPEAFRSGPTFGPATVQRPGSNAACRALCRAKKAKNADVAYYAVGQPFSYNVGSFGKRKGEGAACECVTVATLKARVKSGLAGKGKGCGGALGGSGGEDSVAVFAIDPDSV